MSGILFSDSLDLRLAAFMFALILIFTLVWEDLTQRLEDKLADQIHFLQMLSKVGHPSSAFMMPPVPVSSLSSALLLSLTHMFEAGGVGSTAQGARTSGGVSQGESAGNREAPLRAACTHSRGCADAARLSPVHRLVRSGRFTGR